jgi:hypothetical protein
MTIARMAPKFKYSFLLIVIVTLPPPTYVSSRLRGLAVPARVAAGRKIALTGDLLALCKCNALASRRWAVETIVTGR